MRELAQAGLRASCPRPLHDFARRSETDDIPGRHGDGRDTLFEELGFYYVGPVDGHNLDHLLPVLENVRDSDRWPGA